MSHTPQLALVADDNAALARVISFTLKKNGFDVCQAANGAEAWGLAQEKSFDLVVTDQQMPEMTGLELTARLRESEAHRNTPIVLLTAKGMELDVDRLREEYGVTQMLIKPFSPSALATTAAELTTSAV